MNTKRLTLTIAFVLFAGASWAAGQTSPQTQQPAKLSPYRAVTVTPPQALNEPALEAFRKQLGEVAQKRDRAALAKLTVAQGFFWLGENGDRADKRKSGIDNLTAALGLSNRDGPGWDMLASFADDPTGSSSPEYKGALCSPADPVFDVKSFNELLESTKTDAGEWGYPVSPNVDVRTAPQANAPVAEKLGLVFVRIVPEGSANVPTFLRILTPSGKTGFVSVDSIAPLGNDQICYVKEAAGWKIGGYVGGGDSQ